MRCGMIMSGLFWTMKSSGHGDDRYSYFFEITNTQFTKSRTLDPSRPRPAVFPGISVEKVSEKRRPAERGRPPPRRPAERGRPPPRRLQFSPAAPRKEEDRPADRGSDLEEEKRLARLHLRQAGAARAIVLVRGLSLVVRVRGRVFVRMFHPLVDWRSTRCSRACLRSSPVSS